jgi:hypothetical protein
LKKGVYVMGILWVRYGYVMVMSAEYPLNVGYLSRTSLVNESKMSRNGFGITYNLKKKKNT